MLDQWFSHHQGAFTWGLGKHRAPRTPIRISERELQHSIFFLIDFTFQRSFRFTVKLSGEYRDFPYTYCPNTWVALPIASSTRVVYLLTDEPALTQHYHPNPQFTLRSLLAVVHSVDVDESVMTCVYHYKILQNGFTVLKILCASPTYPTSIFKSHH